MTVFSTVPILVKATKDEIGKTGNRFNVCKEVGFPTAVRT